MLKIYEVSRTPQLAPYTSTAQQAATCFIGLFSSFICFFFFFSSRRRHTRCSRDWSSDVCSSDLAAESQRGFGAHTAKRDRTQNRLGRCRRRGKVERDNQRCSACTARERCDTKIGRASCRERV